ncbi:kinase-like domain-containing protein [Lactarius psammicola]|nr:kinase-like domain-containing protein [Lactarius psammicola]
MSLSQNDNHKVIEFDLTTAEGVLAYLATTPFASASAELLSGGSTNFIFRLRLNAPYKGRQTLVLKHARPYVAGSPDFPLPVSRQDFDVDALRGVRAWLPPDACITVPVVHHFDHAMHAAIMDDAGPGAAPLKAALLAGHIPSPRAATLGTTIGQFLRALHTWGRGTEAGGTLREALGANVFARDIYAFITYGRVCATLRTPGGETTGAAAGGQEPLPALGDEPLGVPEETLRVIEELAERRVPQIRDVRGDTLVMGDFWPGNVLVGERGGGRFAPSWRRCGILHPERAEAAGEVLNNFVHAYFAGDVGPEADETRRVALGHFGVHLAVWTPRAEWNAGVQAKRALVMKGVKHLVEGADPERVWTDEELVHRFMG